MEECSVLIETTKSAEDKTSRWFDLPIDYELFRDLLGVEADSKDYQITDMKLPFAGDIVRTTSVRRLNKLYFAYTDLSPEVQQAYKELIPYCGGVEDLLQKSEEFLFYPECHNIMDVARYRLEHLLITDASVKNLTVKLCSMSWDAGCPVDISLAPTVAERRPFRCTDYNECLQSYCREVSCGE